MNEVATVEKNPFTGAGYRLDAPQGRMTRIADYMNHEKVVGTIQAVLPENAKGFVASVLNEIRKSMSDDKKDLTKCNPQSIINCCVDAARLKLFIDGRQHAHLVKRGENVTLQIGYRGYLARLEESLRGFVPIVELVYEGEEFQEVQEGSKSSFIHKRSNQFGSRKDSEIIGAYAFLEWSPEPGRVVSKLTTINRDDIAKMRSKATTDYVWAQWFGEMVKKSVIRRACKVHFATVTNDLDTKDNENFDLRQNKRESEETRRLSEQMGNALAGEAGPTSAIDLEVAPVEKNFSEEIPL